VCFLCKTARRGEASLGYINTEFTFYMPVAEPGLITGRPCALSQAGCLTEPTAEERMLWLECCGVNSGEHSSRRWVMAGVAQPAEQIKWLLFVTWLHTLSVHISWFHPTGSGFNTRFPNMKSIGDINVHALLTHGACSCSFIRYSGLKRHTSEPSRHSKSCAGPVK